MGAATWARADDETAQDNRQARLRTRGHMARRKAASRTASGGRKTGPSRNLMRRLQFEALLSELSSTFVKIPSDEVDAAIEYWLCRLVEFLRVDRAGVSQVLPDGNAV